MLWRLIKLLFSLAVLGGLGLIIYAYVGPILFAPDFAAPSQQVREPVVLEFE